MRPEASLPSQLEAYLDMIAHGAADTDADVDALRATYSEQEILDVTMAASIGAMAGRIEEAWSLLPPV